MALFERPFDSLEQLHETELEYHKIMFEVGNLIAVPAAMNYCAKHGLNAPPWVVSESAKMHCTDLAGKTPKKRGRSSSIVDRYRQDCVDYARWEEVSLVRENRQYLQQEMDTLRALPGRRARDLYEEFSKLSKWAGTNNLDVFACASMMLRGTRAGGGPDAMRTSYLKVKRNMRNPATAMPYRVLDPEFLRRVGAHLDLTGSAGKKIVPLYDLTL